jgi:MoaA/NifB/PqqE/SkfB family radical SAM enzyme
MPHGACNCRCVMCDIWKGNRNAKQLSEEDIVAMLTTFKKLQTKNIVMSGGEALLNSRFFRFCELLQDEGISITLLSTGILLQKHAEPVARYIRDVIVSLDGDEQTHNRIRNIPDAFRLLADGIKSIRAVDANFRITGRTVIHRHNFSVFPEIINTAHKIGLNQISFLPADVSSQAFNRDTPWDTAKQEEVMLSVRELPDLYRILSELKAPYKNFFDNHFIAESHEKLMKIHSYYSALHGIMPFPFKKCNAPWVSAVVEADGSVRPCFFHAPIGNIRNESLLDLLNSKAATKFRKTLEVDKNGTCERCVCSLNLSPTATV